MKSTDRLLDRVRSRLALVGAVQDLQWGAAAGAVAALIVLGIGALGVEAVHAVYAPITGLIVLLAFPLGGLFLRRRDADRLATLADEHLGLRERLSTARWIDRSKAEGTHPGGPMDHLVREDADAVAANIAPEAVTQAFRPHLMRRPIAIAAVGLIACLGLSMWQPAAEALETADQKTTRLAEENRVAEIARRVREAAREVERRGEARDAQIVIDAARTVEAEASEMIKRPPGRKTALKKLSDVGERMRAEARDVAGLAPAKSTLDALKMDEELLNALDDLAKSGVGSLQKDLKMLEERLRDGGEEGAPSESEMREMAERVDTLRRMLDEMQDGSLAGSDLMEKLQSLANQETLEKIAQKLREIAAKLERDGYESMQAQTGDMPPFDLNSLTPEELEALLKQLEELAAMENLAEMLREAAQSAANGRKFRFDGLKPGGT